MALSKPTASARRDKVGRPVIAVTGMGVITSLGVGKEDNWAKLTAGKSGIRRISRFPLDSLRTTIAGSVNDVYKDYMPPAELSERIALLAGEEAIAQSGIGTKGQFPGPLFLALPPLEIEWPYRIQMAEEATPNGDAGYADLMRVARKPQFADHRLCVRGYRDPARSRGDPARRVPGRSRGRRRRVIDPRITCSILTPFGPLHPKRSARASLQAVLQEPRWICTRRRRGGTGA